MRTLSDLDPTEFHQAIQHIPSFLIKRVGNDRLIEQRLAPDQMAGDVLLESLLDGSDPTIEAVSPHCLHVCLN